MRVILPPNHRTVMESAITPIVCSGLVMQLLARWLNIIEAYNNVRKDRGLLAVTSARDNDGACGQMRLSFSHAVDLFSFLFHWTDCRIAVALGLLRIFIRMV